MIRVVTYLTVLWGHASFCYWISTADINVTSGYEDVSQLVVQKMQENAPASVDSQQTLDNTHISPYTTQISSDTDEISQDADVSKEKLLLRYLRGRYAVYGVDGRPVRNVSHPVTVLFGLGLIKMELRERENMLFMSTWARYRWRDEYLQWDPDKYDGVTDIKMTHSHIWIPDVMLYNTAEPDESQRMVKVVVQYDGTVTWFPHKVYQSSCAVDVRNFPFDNQTCHMWFGSWTHPANEMDVQLAFPGGIDLSTFKSVYKDSSEWEIFNSTAERIVAPEEGTPQFAILSFTLSLNRKMMFSTYILTMPAIFLSFLTLLVFWLPPEHADKSALGLTIFGSLLLLLLILVEAAPPTASAVPLLGVYYCFTTVIVILSIFLSSLVLKVGKAGGLRQPVPRWANMIFVQCLASVLMMRSAGSGRCCLKNCGHRSNFSGVETQVDKRDDHRGSDVTGMRELGDNNRHNGTGPTAVTLLENQLRALHTLIDDVIRRQAEKETVQKARDEIELEWRHLALILDRLFFVSYLVVIILSLTLLFPRSSLRDAMF